MRITADADARAVDLRQAVDVVGIDAEFLADGLAHLLAPALRADDALAQVDLVLDAALLDLLGQEQGIGARRTEDCALHVHHHLQLLLRIAGAHRHGHGAELLAAGLEADTRRPEAVARRDLHTVAVRDTCHRIAARELCGPVLDILRRIRDDDGLPRRARRGVHAHDLLLRHAHEPERIGVAEVLLLRERQLLEFLRRCDVIDAVFAQPLAVKAVCLEELGDALIDERELFI